MNSFTPGIYITGIESAILDLTKRNLPRPRFTRYYEDLYHLYQKSLHQETFHEGGQYAFSKIAEVVMNRCPTTWLHDLDILVTAYWAHEYDPDHSHCGPFLADKYHLNSDLFDVCDQGTLSMFTSIHILQRYFEKKIVKKGMALALEQTTIPRNLSDHDVIPRHNGGVALVLEYLDNLNKVQSSHQIIFKLVNTWIVDTTQLHLDKKTGLDVIFERISSCITNKPLSIVTKKNSVIWKQIKTRLSRKEAVFSHYHFGHFSFEASMLSSGLYLKELLTSYQVASTKQPPTIVLIDEDIESLNIGVMLLEVVNYTAMRE